MVRHGEAGRARRLAVLLDRHLVAGFISDDAVIVGFENKLVAGYGAQHPVVVMTTGALFLRPLELEGAGLLVLPRPPRDGRASAAGIAASRIAASG